MKPTPSCPAAPLQTPGSQRKHYPPSPRIPSAAQTYGFWRWPHAYLRMCRHRYGPRFTIYPVGKPPLVFLCDPADIKGIVSAPADVLHPGAGAAVISPLVGEKSFMLREENEHLAIRKQLMPAFHQPRIAEHTSMIGKLAENEISKWPTNKTVALHPYLRALTLRIVLHTIFKPTNTDLALLHTRLLAMLSITGSLVLQELQLRHIGPWYSEWRHFLEHREGVHELLDRMIAAEEALSEGRVLFHLVNARNPDGTPVSDRQVRDNLMSVILAGHETTASELAWAFQLLAFHPAIQRTLIGSLEDASGTGYLTATVREVLRHRPVFLFTIPRVVRKPIRIGGATYTPPAHLAGCIHLMHHDPALYSEPERFLPTRFLDGPPPSRTWLPWGGGRKHCPGHHLASLEMSTVLKIALESLDVLPAARKPESARWRSVIVTPGKGAQVVLHRRPHLFFRR